MGMSTTFLTLVHSAVGLAQFPSFHHLLDVMSHVLGDIRELLRSTDEVKAVLEATLIPNPSDAEPDEDVGNKRILAVISHKDDWDLIEEGWYASPVALVTYLD